MNFNGKKVLIMGLGTIGKGLKDALFFYDTGAIVTVTDLKTEQELGNSIDELKKYKNITLHLGGHLESDFIENEIIVRNPDVRMDSSFLEIAKKHGNKIIMDESFACKNTKAHVIGITGTRGKSTTTTLIYEILKRAGFDVYISGNVRGTATLPILDKLTENSHLVLELSSWQLQGFEDEKVSPEFSIITNIYPDHLNRGGGMDDYVNDKKNIYRFQKKSDVLFLNKDIHDKYHTEFKNEANGEIIYFSKDFVKNYKTKLLGSHNLENIAVARELCLRLKIDENIIKSVVEQFNPIEFRLEKIREINGISFINDSASTAPIAGVKALESFNEKILLICGGATKGLPIEEFANTICKKAKLVALLSGTETENLKEKIKNFGGENLIIGIFDDFESAVRSVYEKAEFGDIILLSPGCASFGMFKNEFDRGEKFNKIVSSL